MRKGDKNDLRKGGGNRRRNVGGGRETERGKRDSW